MLKIIDAEVMIDGKGLRIGVERLKWRNKTRIKQMKIMIDCDKFMEGKT